MQDESSKSKMKLNKKQNQTFRKHKILRLEQVLDLKVKNNVLLIEMTLTYGSMLFFLQTRIAKANSALANLIFCCLSCL